MLLDVRKIINAPGERIDFQFDMDLSDVDFPGPSVPEQGGNNVFYRVHLRVGQQIAGVWLLETEIKGDHLPVPAGEVHLPGGYAREEPHRVRKLHQSGGLPGPGAVRLFQRRHPGCLAS